MVSTSIAAYLISAVRQAWKSQHGGSIKSSDQAIEHWLGQAVQELPPESAANVISAFQSAGGKATVDVIALYGRIGGMQMMDGNHFRLWPLQEVREENNSSSKYGVLFGDYLINCWCYRLVPISEDESAVYADFFDDTPPILVGKSLNEFLSLCINDPDAVLHQPR